MKVFVTGGAGYVGSITVKRLLDKGFSVTVFDDLSKGHREAVSCPLIVGDLKKKEDILKALAADSFDAVIHFAASTTVGESVKDPHRYLQNNVLATVNLLDAMLKVGVKNLVFSSTSEAYGEAKKLPLLETMPPRPLNPYGLSKVMVEQMLPWYDKVHGLRFIILRYFNAAGATLDGSLGEDHRPELHLIPNAVRAALGLTDFELTCARVNTPDGSTIRDYTHVLDLAEAHILSLEALAEGYPSDIFNVGYGRGFSTLEVVNKIQEVTGVKFPIKRGEVRRGEPAAKFASNEKIKKKLGWEPQYGLDEIITSAYLWHKNHPEGFNSK